MNTVALPCGHGTADTSIARCAECGSDMLTFGAMLLETGLSTVPLPHLDRFPRRTLGSTSIFDDTTALMTERRDGEWLFVLHGDAFDAWCVRTGVAACHWHARAKEGKLCGEREACLTQECAAEVAEEFEKMFAARIEAVLAALKSALTL